VEPHALDAPDAEERKAVLAKTASQTRMVERQIWPKLAHPGRTSSWPFGRGGGRGHRAVSIAGGTARRTNVRGLDRETVLALLDIYEAALRELSEWDDPALDELIRRLTVRRTEIVAALAESYMPENDDG
jgi:hypothetical protein